MEKVNEGKPILKGEKLEERMKELARMIEKEHEAAGGTFKTFLEHARNAGEWLLEAQWRKGRRSKWGKWKRSVADAKRISTRTMSQYMQIARYWDDPRIKAARRKGFDINTIQKFLQVLRGHHPENKKQPTPKEEERGDHIKRIRLTFNQLLPQLDDFEIEIFSDTVQYVFREMYADLQERVCGNYEGPYYEYRREYGKEHSTITDPVIECPTILAAEREALALQNRLIKKSRS